MCLVRGLLIGLSATLMLEVLSAIMVMWIL